MTLPLPVATAPPLDRRFVEPKREPPIRSQRTSSRAVGEVERRSGREEGRGRARSPYNSLMPADDIRNTTPSCDNYPCLAELDGEPVRPEICSVVDTRPIAVLLIVALAFVRATVLYTK